MKQKIVVVTVRITKANELNFFQVNLPRDIDRIVGMQAGAMAFDNINPLTDRYVAGIIKVQAENYADLCYSSEMSVGQGAPQTNMTGFNTSKAELLALFSKPDADTGMHAMRLTGCYTLYACFEDKLIKVLNMPITYTARLYVWTETDGPQ